MNFYRFDNRYMLEMIRTYPRVFSGVAIIDSTAPEVEATMRTLSSGSVNGTGQRCPRWRNHAVAYRLERIYPTEYGIVGHLWAWHGEPESSCIHRAKAIARAWRIEELGFRVPSACQSGNTDRPRLASISSHRNQLRICGISLRLPSSSAMSWSSCRT